MKLDVNALPPLWGYKNKIKTTGECPQNTAGYKAREKYIAWYRALKNDKLAAMVLFCLQTKTHSGYWIACLREWKANSGDISRIQETCRKAQAPPPVQYKLKEVSNLVLKKGDVGSLVGGFNTEALFGDPEVQATVANTGHVTDKVVLILARPDLYKALLTREAKAYAKKAKKTLSESYVALAPNAPVLNINKVIPESLAGYNTAHKHTINDNGTVSLIDEITGATVSCSSNRLAFILRHIKYDTIRFTDKLIVFVDRKVTTALLCPFIQ